MNNINRKPERKDSIFTPPVQRRNVTETKRSGHPTPPGNRSTVSTSDAKIKIDNIIHRIAFYFKRAKKHRTELLSALFAVVIAFILTLATLAIGGEEEKPSVEPINTEPATEYIFKDGAGYPVEWQTLTAAWATGAGIEKRYDLTDAERWEVASVITAEAEGEPFAGKVAVAQCILQSCEDDELRPSEVLEKYDYAKSRPEPNEEALEAVQAVFDLGQVASTEPIKYFYAPAICKSTFHESQDYVMTINGHRFFKEVTK